MTEKRFTPDKAADLRRRAEEKAGTDGFHAPETISPEEARKMLHDLRVHQIELEMQNEELRRAQHELEASRAKYFDLYDLAPVGYCTLTEKGLILEANLTAAGLLGVSRSALLKKPFQRFILLEDREIYYRHRKHLFETGAPQGCELRMTGADAAPFWARVEATIARDAVNGAAVCRVIISDINTQKNIEAALRRKAKESQAKNDDMTRLNHAVSRDLRIMPDMIQKEPVNILLVEDEPAHAEAIKLAFRDSGMKAVVRLARNLREYQALTAAQQPDIAIVDIHLPDGNAVDVLMSPQETGPFPILILTGYGDARIAVEAMKAGAIDFIEKSSGSFEAIPHTVQRSLREWKMLMSTKRAEAALRREKMNFQHSLDNSPLGVRIVTPDGDTLYANRAMLEMYRYDSIEELRNTPLKKRYTPESYVECQKRVKIRQRGGSGPSEYEIGIVRKTGEVRHLHVFRKGTLWNDEKQFQLLYRDVTEDMERDKALREFEKTIQGQKMLLDQKSSSVSELIDRLTRSKAELRASYEALKANRNELIFSEKLAFTGRMAASIAHEIRNPLTNIILSVRQLKKDDSIKPAGLQYTAIVERNTNRIQFLIAELLNCASPIKLNLQPWDIHLVINNVLKTHKVRLKMQSIKLIKKLTPYPSTLLVDKEYMGRVLLNLTANAIEAMPSGGRLSIVTTREKGHFVIKIKDSGRGIPEKNLMMIFDHFFSTKKGGTGLGLPTCQNIVSSHGGMIEVESKWNKGSSFSVCLPVGQNPMESVRYIEQE